jgi:NADH:ubiquinone oxidoreductase subunit 4 (subunit M)
MPLYAFAFMVFTLANIGLPGTTGFIGEFLTMIAEILDVEQARLLQLAKNHLAVRATARTRSTEWCRAPPSLNY